MYVCLCKGITERDIQNAVDRGESFSTIRRNMGVSSECGTCTETAKKLVKLTQQQMRELEHLAYAV